MIPKDQVYPHMYVLEFDDRDYCIPINKEGHASYHTLNGSRNKNGTFNKMADHGLGGKPSHRRIDDEKEILDFYTKLGINVRFHERIIYYRGNIYYSSRFSPTNGKSLFEKKNMR